MKGRKWDNCNSIINKYIKKKKIPIAVLDVLADYFRNAFVFRCKEILNSDVTHRARSIQDEDTLACLWRSTSLEEGEVPLIIWTTHCSFHVKCLKVSRVCTQTTVLEVG